MLAFLLHAAVGLLLVCPPVEVCALRIDMTRHSYPLDSTLDKGGLNVSGAAALCRLRALSENVPNVAAELAAKSERWVGVAERLWASVSAEWGRLQLLNVAAHGLSSADSATARAHGRVLDAVKVANRTMSLVRSRATTVIGASVAAEEAAADAIDGDGSPFGGLKNILERHCGSKRCKVTSNRLRCKSCMTTLVEMFPTTDIRCDKLSAPAVRAAASIGAMTEALARWDEIRPKFDPEYRMFDVNNCEPTPEYSCSVLEDWSPHFFAAVRLLAEAQAALAECAEAVASAQAAFESARREVDVLERESLSKRAKTNTSATSGLLHHLGCDIRVPTARSVLRITGAAM
ncbi:invariant surface glycoprotein, putative [Trypanosoma vivax Y486]|uniref:Invariant surface glycoprotein, putative n=1 Tax=Trypanosoma vivax (strain Y486) TaxID=1055687 RepID=F9WM60_TRYVY|nr:invariant surface glycoprotein, putative [Trypanosoma vivax Y486]|eukprot:CCD18611.1 invariant surface glycoprotein, putative [Trypanosoma vivax Y486]